MAYLARGREAIRNKDDLNYQIGEVAKDLYHFAITGESISFGIEKLKEFIQDCEVFFTKK